MTSTTDNKSSAPNSQMPVPSFPLLGLGASAGGIQALQTFFDNMPDQSGMAFVVIMHLSSEFESNLANILQNRTPMPVVQVTETTRVLPNHVYVIPPSKHLLLQEGHIHLTEPQQAGGKRLAIDLFFRTLAATYGPRALAMVLSGSDGDGTIGIKHIKEQGGITLVQDPTEAEFDSMPRSAIATGMVDWILPVGQMPTQLLKFMRNEAQMHIPPEELQSPEDAQAEDRNSGGSPAIRKEASAGDEEALLAVLHFLRAQTGHDFTHYKRATILRRVARRMQVNLLEDIPVYLEFLHAHPEEAVALLHDLLISVTNFFRDASSFASLQSHIPQLFADKAAADPVRVWVAGCATGEEAYTVAMLLLEHAAKLENPSTIQVFATDLDDNAIAVARTGLYPAAIESDISPERLRRFFQREEGGYRVRKELRERVLFSVHNLLNDPPFSRLDLVTCRNLLIYLKRDAQEGVFDLFHFALRVGGLLFLGSAESIADSHPLFAPLDRQNRLFVRRSGARGNWQLPIMPMTPPRILQAGPPATPSGAEGLRVPSATSPLPSTVDRHVSRYGDLHLSALEQFAPPSILINASYDMVHLSEHAGRFLQMAGEPSRNLLQVVHPALRVELRTALFRALQQHSEVTTVPIPLEEAGTHFVTLHVRPFRGADTSQELLVVVFEPTEEPAGAPPAPDAPDAFMRRLEEENQHLRAQLSATVQQYEASLKELKAANEEHQSTNEEMRSSAEELETSKEELQSTNEELTTVNQELKSNVDELGRANGDLQNLMASTEIGTIFLDRELRIKRYTPRIRELFNIIPTDVGRPLSDLTHKLNYSGFAEEAERVLADLARSEREVRSNGNVFLARMLPYRTPDDYIDGVVLNFVDITERKKAESGLRESEEKYRSLFETMTEGFAVCDLIRDADGRVIDWRLVEINQAWERQTGVVRADAIGMTVHALFPGMDASWGETITRVMESGEPEQVEIYTTPLDRWFHATVYRRGPEQFVTIYDDISVRKRAEQALRESRAHILRELENTKELQKVSSLLIEDEDSDRLYGQLLDAAMTIMRGDFGSIQMLDDARGELRLLAWRNFHPRSAEYWQTVSVHNGTTCGAALKHGERVIVSDVRETEFLKDTEDLRQYEKSGIRAVQSMPLVTRAGHVIGMISTHWREPHAPNDRELRLLDILARQAADFFERRGSQEALRASKERVQLATEAAELGIWVWEPTTERVSWENDRMYEIYGLSPSDPIFTTKQFLDAIVDPEDAGAYARAIARPLETGEPLYFEGRFWRKDGALRWIEFRGRLQEKKDGEPLRVVGTTADITDRKQAEHALKEHTREIEDLNLRLQRSMKETHHRVKNNLQVIAAMIEMQVLEHKGEQSISTAEFLRLQTHVHTLAIIHDLLTKGVKENEDQQRVSTKAVLDKLLPMLQRTAWKQTVRYEVNEAALTSKQCIALSLVLNELVSNALKHGKEEVEVFFTTDVRGATLTVRDDGSGFPEGFDPKEVANTGLELVDSLVRIDLRGSIAYSTRPEGGGQVNVAFPLPPVEA